MVRTNRQYKQRDGNSNKESKGKIRNQKHGRRHKAYFRRTLGIFNTGEKRNNELEVNVTRNGQNGNGKRETNDKNKQVMKT